MNEEISQLNKELSEVNKRMGVIISLLLQLIPKEGSALSLKDQVRMLDSFGMRPKDMANILGRTQSHINKELAGVRKKAKKNEQ
jgi:hypothetical protein